MSSYTVKLTDKEASKLRFQFKKRRKRKIDATLHGSFDTFFPTKPWVINNFREILLGCTLRYGNACGEVDELYNDYADICIKPSEEDILLVAVRGL